MRAAYVRSSDMDNLLEFQRQRDLAITLPLYVSCRTGPAPLIDCCCFPDCGCHLNGHPRQRASAGCTWGQSALTADQGYNVRSLLMACPSGWKSPFLNFFHWEAISLETYMPVNHLNPSSLTNYPLRYSSNMARFLTGYYSQKAMCLCLDSPFMHKN